MTDLADLLADCDAHGIRLTAASDVGLTIDAPQGTLTPELIGRLKAHKAALLTLLWPTPDLAPTRPAKAVCRCGATTWRDVPIHGGQSIRRDCGQCGRFIDFPFWHGKATLHNAQ